MGSEDHRHVIARAHDGSVLAMTAPTPARRALITGVTGQDGYYLSQHLLGLGYTVHGLVRQTLLESESALQQPMVDPRVNLHVAALDNSATIYRLLSEYHFDECYHLAAQSFAGESLTDGLYTLNHNIAATHNLLSAVLQASPQCRFYLAGSSEMFGKVSQAPQNENTPFLPRNAYGISKLACFHLVRNFREQHGLFAVTGILYNHESPRRGEQFVTRKITSAAVRIKLGLAKELRLGNLDAQRDWGYAGDYVIAMQRMLACEQPEDFIVATGKLHSVRDFLDAAFGHLGLDWRAYVIQDPKFARPLEAVNLVGDARRAQERLAWRPALGFEEMVKLMVDHDLARHGRGLQ